MQEMEIEQIAHFSPEEQTGIDQLVETLVARKSAPTEEELKLLCHPRATDIALFGRMLAAAPAFNVEAAAQVAHAITVHRCQVEDDFFTAVDDLNDHSEDAGAGHMGNTEFGAGLFYLYVCIDRAALLKNLGEDRALFELTLRTLVECTATVAPTGKQNSFASRAYASYALAEKGDRQPRALSVAFLKPVEGADMGVASIKAMEECRDKMDKVYGPCATVHYTFNALTGDGSLEALQIFSVAE
jgi:CRISPR system Cascade subunit CasC